MKYRASIILITTLFLIVNYSLGQTKCDTLYDFPDKEASFKNDWSDLLIFFNDNILELISTTNGLPPTSFKMTLIINDNNEVESIYEILGDYSEKSKNQILETLKKEVGWRSGEINGQKVCSKFYFTIGCILWN
ncbi:MAG: hypothetical protein MK066_09915 [Crocinitomicaceae bacterium]|nr:hypothetical protein [Crocinitomicaceae bacterium]